MYRTPLQIQNLGEQESKQQKVKKNNELISMFFKTAIIISIFIIIFLFLASVVNSDSVHIFQPAIAGANNSIGYMILDTQNTTRNNIYLSTHNLYFPIIFSENNFNLDNNTHKRIDIIVDLQDFYLKPGNYNGNIVVTSSLGSQNLPINVNLLSENAFELYSNLTTNTTDNVYTLKSEGDYFVVSVINLGNYDMEFAIDNDNPLFITQNTVRVLKGETQQVKIHYVDPQNTQCGINNLKISFKESDNNIKYFKLNYTCIDIKQPEITEFIFERNIIFGDPQIIKFCVMDNNHTKNMSINLISKTQNINITNLTITNLTIHNISSSCIDYNFKPNESGEWIININAFDFAGNYINKTDRFYISQIKTYIELNNYDWGKIQEYKNINGVILTSFGEIKGYVSLVSKSCSNCSFVINGKEMNVDEQNRFALNGDQFNSAKLSYSFNSKIENNTDQAIFVVKFDFDDNYLAEDRLITISATPSNLNFLKDYRTNYGGEVKSTYCNTNNTGISNTSSTTCCVEMAGVIGGSEQAKYLPNMNEKVCDILVQNQNQAKQIAINEADRNLLFGVFVLFISIFLSLFWIIDHYCIFSYITYLKRYIRHQK